MRVRISSLRIPNKLRVKSNSENSSLMSRTKHWRAKERSPREKAERAAAYALKMGKQEEKVDYTAWSNEKLIERVTQLENELKNKNSSLQPSPSSPQLPPEKKSWKKPSSEKVFDGSKYSTRLIALKIAYLGKRYNGFEHHSNQATPLPTIEEELWHALNKARLIFPKDTTPGRPGKVEWEGTEYSKCGRTDKGVSAFGQVIGIRVRSSRPLAKKRRNSEGNHIAREGSAEDMFNTFPRDGGVELSSPPLDPVRLAAKESRIPEEELTPHDYDYEEALNFDHIADELPYPSLLNRLLPPDIRVIAWCPTPPVDFSARFSCRERQYRYFFTQPAFTPVPHSLSSPSPSAQPNRKDGWLDIDVMRIAAKNFEGLHDFRNFCKIDGGKQIDNFERRIFKADIEEVAESSSSLAYLNTADFLPADQRVGYPKIYTFTLHGSAFLWHQVRCMVSILFLVAQGLEKPDIVKDLLDPNKYPRRPTYDMASDTPLVLWDCIFPLKDDVERKDALDWVYMGEGRLGSDEKYGTDGLMENLWKVWRERKVDEVLAGALIDVVSAQGVPVEELQVGKGGRGKGARSQKVFEGGDGPRLHGNYVPISRKPLMDSPATINEKYALRKGFEGSEDLKIQGYKRLGGKPTSSAAPVGKP